MRNSDQRGFSTIELAISAVIFAMVIAAMYQIVMPTFSLARSSTERITVQQDSRLAMDRLSRDLRESHVARVRVYDGGRTIGFATARAGCAGDFVLDPLSGAALWQAVVYVSLDTASGQVRRYCDTTTTFPGAAPRLSGPFSVIARNVQSVTFTWADEVVAVALHEDTPRGNSDRFIRTGFVPQNED